MSEEGAKMSNLIKFIEELISDKETEHQIAIVHRYNRMLRRKIERGGYNYNNYIKAK
jgi:hypothetical protein